ncbi:hypothetical protein PPSIR1_40760 [Plesiocystis pacifica SIR-1]|uniref:DUF6603 domain-containing protein n=1 Tax=Plesiocystis pacifica SIR-1 TaxID=391625 RepID=A6FYT2_9BACT|nr:DUF6603 domain-containing protein [Plesiocystis pacifica]EDM81354.1 hypothetical protein PPSIR1_40760 [Plesiocystis pacifica SIR-1]
MNDLIGQDQGNGLLLDLAKALGIVTPDGDFNTDWFGDDGGNGPGQHMIDLVQGKGDANHQRRLALLRALDQLFDSGSSELDETLWSLALGDSGLDLLIRATPDDASPGSLEFVIGLGGRWKLTPDESKPVLTLEAQFNLLVVDTENAEGFGRNKRLRLADSLEARLELSDITENAHILDGVALVASLPFWELGADGSEEHSLVSIQLQGIGPRNDNINFSFDSSPEWSEFEQPLFRLLMLGVAVLIGLIPDGSDDAARAAKNAALSLLALLGWSETEGNGYPELSLDALIANPGLALQQWLQDIWSDFDNATDGTFEADNKVRLFLERLVGTLAADDALTIEADGRYIAVYPDAWATAAVRLELVLWSTTDASGTERLHLGLRTSARESLGASGPVMIFEALADIASFPLSGPLSANFAGEFCVDLRLVGQPPGAPDAPTPPALDISAAQLAGDSRLAFLGAMSIGEVVAGVKLDYQGKFEPMLELRELIIDKDDHARTWPVLDLTNGNAAVDAAEDMATHAVAAVIRNSLNLTPEGHAIAILIGLDTPEGVTDYPQIDAQEFVGGPLDAYEVWIGRLLADNGGTPWFKTWLDTLQGLLDGIDGDGGFTVPAITGAGETDDPWRMVMASGEPGDVAFEFHILPDPTGGPMRTLGVDLAASLNPIALGPDADPLAAFEARAVAGLVELSIDDPAADDPAVAVRPVPGASVYAALIPPEGETHIRASIDGEASNGDPASVVFGIEAARLVASVDWERGQDPVPAFDLVDPGIVIADAERLDLRDLMASLPPLPGGSLPSLRFDATALGGSSPLSGFGVGAFSGSGLSIAIGDLPDFGQLNFSLDNFGFASAADAQWAVELGEFMMRLLTLGVPSWALDGDAGEWRSWVLGVVQLLGGWPGLDLGTAAGAALSWPSSDFGADFAFDVAAFRRLLTDPLGGLKLRLGQLFTVDGAGPAGMVLLWRWLRGEMPTLDGALARPEAPAVTGSGTYEDPWAIRLNEAPEDAEDRDFPVELIVWVDPSGPDDSTASHVGFGLRLDLAPDSVQPPAKLTEDGGEVQYEFDTYFRADLFTVDVSEVTENAGTARVTPALSLEAELRHAARDDDTTIEEGVGWLLLTDASAVHLRAIELGLRWNPTDGFDPYFELIDAGFQDSIGAPATTASLSGLLALSVGGVVLDTLAQEGGPLADDSFAPLMTILECLGVVVAEGEGFGFLAEPMVRLIEDPGAYMAERFWDEGVGVPRLRPLQSGFEAVGFTVHDGGAWQVEVPLGNQVLYLDEDGTLRVSIDEAVADTVDIGVVASFNPFSGQTQGVLTTRVGSAPLELVATWSDPDGYGNSDDTVFELGIHPRPGTLEADGEALVTDMENLFGGPLILYPVADAGLLGERILTIGYRLAIEAAVAALFGAFVEPHLSAQARQNLEDFGILDEGGRHPNPLWELFDDPVGKILGKLRELEGVFPIADGWEIFAGTVADGRRILMLQSGDIAVDVGGQPKLGLNFGLGVNTENWDPHVDIDLDFQLDEATTVELDFGLTGPVPSLTVCGIQLLPTFTGFSSVSSAINLLLPAALAGILQGLHDAGGDAATAAGVIEGLFDDPAPNLAARYDAIEAFVGGLIAQVETPNIGWFETEADSLLSLLEGCLGLLSGHGVNTRRFGPASPSDWTQAPPENESGTRTYVWITGIPVAIVVGWDPNDSQFGIWMTAHGDADFGYVAIAKESIAGGYVGAGMNAGGECTLGLSGRIPDPVNLEPTVLFRADSAGLLELDVVLRPTPDRPEDAEPATVETEGAVVFRVLPDFSVDADDDAIKGLLTEVGLPILDAILDAAGLQRDQTVFDIDGTRITVEHMLYASAGLMALAGGIAYFVIDTDGALGTLMGYIGDITDAIDGATGYDIFFIETVDGGKRLGVQMPDIAPPQLVADPKVELLIGTPEERPRVPLLFIPDSNPADTHFDVGIGLRNIGLRVGGSGGKPLLDAGITLGSVQATFDFDIGPGEWTTSNLGYGFGLGLNNIGLPFGQASSDSDPVAGSLMSEGADNPGIDIEVSWDKPAGSSEGAFQFRFPQSNAPDGGRLELPMDMQFGPLELTALTVAAAAGAIATNELAGETIDFTFDGSFGLGPLQITVDDFGLAIPPNSLAKPETWSITLSGLAVEFDQDPVQISAGLLKKETTWDHDNDAGTPKVAITEYNGFASVRVGTFEIAAVGSYASLDDGDASLFIFALIPVPLGGPPMFFIEGLAGGFGYNRGFRTPRIDEVATHPLMAALAGSGDVLDVLDSVSSHMPIKRGSYWFAAGIKFSSFVFIKGAALLYILFDQGFEFGLLGQASIKLPTASNAVLSVGLVLSVGFTTRGSAGPMLWAEAQLTEDSWVLHKDIRLTGGFALRSWFNTGETVLSIGGYHPAFVPPEQYDYPVVPRIGLRWKISDAVSIKGECYFAITPREAMTGGLIEVVGKFGPVKAWLSAGFDILIGWDPFYYDLRMHISIGFEVDLWFAKIRMSVGVQLFIKGPEMSGKAIIDLAIVSFTVKFGASRAPVQAPASIKSFALTQLALPNVSGGADGPIRSTRGKEDGADEETSPIEFTISKGVITDGRAEDAIPAIGPEATFLIRSTMPFNEAAQVNMRSNGANLVVQDFSPSPKASDADTGSDNNPDLPEDTEHPDTIRIDLLPTDTYSVTSRLEFEFKHTNGSHAQGLRITAKRSPLPKAMFAGRAAPHDIDDAHLKPDDGEGSTVMLPDHFEIVAEPAFQEVSTLSAYDKEMAEYDHHLPLGSSGSWGNKVDKSKLQEQFTSAAQADDYRVQGLSLARQKNAAGLAVGTSASSYLSAMQSPQDALNSTIKRSKGSGSSAGSVVQGKIWEAAWKYRATLEVVGAVFPAYSGVTKTSALTQTSTRGIRSAARAARVMAPMTSERESFMVGVRLRNVGRGPKQELVRGVGRSFHRDRVSERNRKAMLDQTRALVGKDPRKRDGARLNAGMTQVFDVPDDGLPKRGGKRMRLRMKGTQAGRLLCLARDGTVLQDLEYGPGQQAIDLPGGTKRVVAAGLGKPEAFRKQAKQAGKPTTPSKPAKPSKPGASIPQKPQKPGASIPQKPQKPGASIPQKPQKPGASIPQKPQKPGASIPQKPQKPGASIPQKPGASIPQKPGMSTPQKTPQKPAAQKPAAKKPAAQMPAAKKPAAQMPAAKKPAAQMPAAKKPAASIPMRPGGGLSPQQMARIFAAQNRGKMMRPGAGMKLLGGSKLSSAKSAKAATQAAMLHNPRSQLANLQGAKLMANDPRRAAMLAELARKQQLAATVQGNLANAAAQKQKPINLGLPRGRGQGIFTSRYARRDVATVGFDEGSRLVRVTGRTFLARGSTVQILDGTPRLEALQAGQARKLLHAAKRVRVTMPASATTLIVLSTSSLTGHSRLSDGIRVEAEGAKLGKAQLVLMPGQGALVFPVQTKSDYSVDITIARGFRIFGVVGGPGNNREWAQRLASMGEWDIVEDGPLSSTGTTHIRLEVLK